MLNPTDEDDLAQALAGARSPLAIRGGGTRPVGKPVAGEALSVSQLSGIPLYEPGALTLTARAGTPVVDVENLLASEDQMLAFEPMDHRKLLGTKGEPTIGGVVAANVSGPRRVQAGAARDFLLGVRFVDGLGNVLKNGGRVMKNVTGYDLARMLAGSRGTLGVLTEVSFKVLPRPETAGVLLLTGLPVPAAVKAMSAALTSPFNVSGAAHVPIGLDGNPVTMIRVEGFESSVAYRCGRLKDLLAQFGPAEIERRSGAEGGPGYEAGWKWIRDVEPFRDKTAVWRVSVKPSDAPVFLTDISDAAPVADALLDWGGGLLWIGADVGQLQAIVKDNDPMKGAESLHRELQTRARNLGGHATLVKGDEELRRAVQVFQSEPTPLTRLAVELRRKFDPKGILNTGLMD